MMMMFNCAMAQMVIYHLPYSTIPSSPSPKSPSSTTNFAPETRGDQQHSTLTVRNRNLVLKCERGACWSEDTTCSSRVPAYRPHYLIARLLGHIQLPSLYCTLLYCCNTTIPNRTDTSPSPSPIPHHTPPSLLIYLRRCRCSDGTCDNNCCTQECCLFCLHQAAA